jgi:hypothetical protein
MYPHGSPNGASMSCVSAMQYNVPLTRICTQWRTRWVNTAEGPLVAITTKCHRPQNLDRPCGRPRVHVPTLPDVFCWPAILVWAGAAGTGSPVGVASADSLVMIGEDSTSTPITINPRFTTHRNFDIAAHWHCILQFHIATQALYTTAIFTSHPKHHISASGLRSAPNGPAASCLSTNLHTAETRSHSHSNHCQSLAGNK